MTKEETRLFIREVAMRMWIKYDGKYEASPILMAERLANARCEVIPKTPIFAEARSTFYTSDGYTLSDNDIARDLTEFYEMKRRQSECRHGLSLNLPDGSELFVAYKDQKYNKKKFCPDCGVDLNKGANHES